MWPANFKTTLVAAFTLCMCFMTHAAVKPCEVRLSIKNGGQVQEFRYRFRDQQLRIERSGKIIPSPPVNILEVETGLLSIIHPHNGTWEQGSIVEGTHPVSPAPVAIEASIPAIEERPRMDPPTDWPDMPSGMPAGIGPGAKKPSPTATLVPGMPAGMPAFPAMPDFPMEGMGGDEPLTLVSLNQTNELAEFSCRLYEATVAREGKLVVWLSDDPRLPPFHLLRHELPNSRQQPEWNEQLAEQLRKKNLFPFKVELKAENGQTIISWTVLSVRTDLKKEEFDGLFTVPDGLYQLPSEHAF